MAIFARIDLGRLELEQRKVPRTRNELVFRIILSQ